MISQPMANRTEEDVRQERKSIKEMSKADALFMCDGWKEARGCRIERQVAQEYGIKILYEDFFVNKPELSTRTLYCEEESYDK